MQKSIINTIFPPGVSNVPQLRKAAKAWAAANRAIPAIELKEIVTTFIKDPSELKKCMGGILLGYMPAQRELLDPFVYEEWLEHTDGWGAVDSICYGVFTATQILGNFSSWRRLVETLAISPSPIKHRGAIVLLARPVKESADGRLSKLAPVVVRETGNKLRTGTKTGRN